MARPRRPIGATRECCFRMNAVTRFAAVHLSRSMAMPTGAIVLVSAAVVSGRSRWRPKQDQALIRSADGPILTRVAPRERAVSGTVAAAESRSIDAAGVA